MAFFNITPKKEKGGGEIYGIEWLKVEKILR